MQTLSTSDKAFYDLASCISILETAKTTMETAMAVCIFLYPLNPPPKFHIWGSEYLSESHEILQRTGRW